jgi:hypothetical protein
MILWTSTKAPNIDFCYKPYIPWNLLMSLFKPTHPSSWLLHKNIKRKMHIYVTKFEYTLQARKQEEFEDIKGVIRIRKSQKNRQHNGQIWCYSMILRTSTKAPNIDFCYKPYITNRNRKVPGYSPGKPHMLQVHFGSGRRWDPLFTSLYLPCKP